MTRDSYPISQPHRPVEIKGALESFKLIKTTASPLTRYVLLDSKPLEASILSHMT